MRSPLQKTARPIPVTRLFESTRSQGASLATAFEKALPVIRRTATPATTRRVETPSLHSARTAS